MFGKGFMTGAVEIFGPYTASNFNYLSGLVPGRLCSFDSDFVEEGIGALPVRRGQELTARVLLDQTTSTYGQLLTLSHTRARDRVASVLLRLDTMLEREGGYVHILPLAHDDIALLASLKRTTVSRELKALADAGAVRLGYRSIELLDALRREYGFLIEASLPFYGAASAT
ncbi:Crp/Fnr family transcriptional regulator [Adlercreutzia equolifaciens]|uniref:Crp/Fnr family transcriptional regulator n=1 Tax=Adlercreutzia equolifaciens TaxID=446660 RepID=UPI003A842EE0